MALQAKSLFLWNFEINELNSSLDFKATSGGPVLQATLRFGYYSLGRLMSEIKRAMEVVDPARTYSVTADRTINSGTENRVTISTNGAFLSLLFATGPRASSSVNSLIGFASSDYISFLTYTGTVSAGDVLIPDYVGYNYIGPEMMRNVFGALNITASGEKEAVVWSVMKFLEVEFKFEPQAKIVLQWRDFLTWAIQQRSFEFTPEISSPTLFFDVTMESTSADGKALGYKVAEMLPEFPFYFRTGSLKMRIKQ